MEALGALTKGSTALYHNKHLRRTLPAANPHISGGRISQLTYHAPHKVQHRLSLPTIHTTTVLYPVAFCSLIAGWCRQ